MMDNFDVAMAQLWYFPTICLEEAQKNHKPLQAVTVPAEVQTKNLLNFYSETLEPIHEMSQQTLQTMNNIHSLQVSTPHVK
jgi:hypothetical protein